MECFRFFQPRVEASTLTTMPSEEEDELQPPPPIATRPEKTMSIVSVVSVKLPREST